MASALAARPAQADEPVGAREPRLMGDTAEITMVADAFDKGNPFDLNIVVGFTQAWKHANIRRETTAPMSGDVTAIENIASYSSRTSALLAGADIGIYHDLALLLRVPIILSWAQQLSDLDGSAAASAQRLADPTGKGQLFSVPFSSPTRSGLDYVSAALDWGIFNQHRDPTKPTWVVGLEGRLGVGTPLHACNASATPECADPATGAPRSPGISRGMDSIIAKSIWSRRFGYVEPYTGFSIQADFPQASSDFGESNATNDLDHFPPILGSFTVGMEVVPYEQRESFQKFSADFRFNGTYHSPGRDYSELFDALGSSQAPSLRTPNPASFVAGPNGTSVANAAGPQVYFTGITEQQAFGSFTLSASATWQAGEYIKFRLGSDFSYAQSHLITTADPCTPGNTNAAAAGPCVNTMTGQVQGVPNPDHRDAIDSPGHRFSVDDTTVVDLWIMGIVMF